MITCYEKLRKSALVQSVIIATLCIVIFLLGPISSFETNDDVYYNLLFEGKLVTNAPEPHAVFVNFVLSYIFAKIYSVIPQIPWYGTFHVVSIVASVFFLNYVFSIARNNEKFWIRLTLSLACAIPFLFLIQFTKTSIVLAVTGYLGLYLLNEAAFRSRLQSLLLHAIAVSFLLLSFSLRKESFFLATILCCFLIVHALLKSKLVLIYALSGMCILLFVFYLVHNHNYGKEWQHFFTLQKLVGPIIDYNQIEYKNNQKVFSEAGLSENDYNFLMNWGYIDGRVYGKERLEQIHKNSLKTRRETQFLPTLQRAISFPALNYILVAGGLTILLLLIYRQQYKLLCIKVLIPLLICTAILALQGRFPSRISTAMFYFLPWAIIVQSGEIRKRWATAVTVAVLLIISFPIYGQIKDISEIADYRLIQNQDLHRLGTLPAGKPIKLATLGASFPYEGFLPFESPNYLSGVQLILLGGMNQSPLQQKQLLENDIDDLFGSLLTDRTTFICLDPALLSIFQTYIFEHYKKYVTFSPIYASNTYVILRIQQDNRH